MPVIGFLEIQSPNGWERYVTAFRQGLKETGFVEGQNVAIAYRWAENDDKRLPALAADLVSRQVSVIAVTGGSFASQVAKTATATIPIVFLMGGDPSPSVSSQALIGREAMSRGSPTLPWG